jgi:hypothetical protein
MAEVERHHDLSFIGEKQFQIRRVKMRNFASYIRYNQSCVSRDCSDLEHEVY